MRKSAAVLAVVVCAAGPAVGQPDPFAEFAVQGNARAMFRRDGPGLRVGSAVTGPNAPRFDFINSSYSVGGDFELVVAYDVAVLGPTGPRSGEGNAELAVNARVPDETFGVHVHGTAGGPRFGVVRNGPNKAGVHYNIVDFPRTADRGRIGMRRKGGELIFLAADGPAAELAELCRYPYNPAHNPTVRLSGYRGFEPEPGALDVRLTDLQVKAAKVLRGADAGRVAPRAAPPAAYPVTADYAASGAKLLADFATANNAVPAFRPVAAGVRVNPPTVPKPNRNAPGHFFRETAFPIAGDFEVSFRVDVAAMGPLPPDGYGTCAVGVAFETDGPCGSVSLCRGAGRDMPGRFTVTRSTPTRGGPSHDTQAFPAINPVCRLVARRTGAEMTFLAQDGLTGPLVELTRTAFVTTPVPHVRLLADQGGTAATPVDATVGEFKIRAARVGDTGPADAVAVAPDAEPTDLVVVDLVPKSASRKWQYLGGSAAILTVGLIVVGGLLARKRKRADRAAVPRPAATDGAE